VTEAMRVKPGARFEYASAQHAAARQGGGEYAGTFLSHPVARGGRCLGRRCAEYRRVTHDFEVSCDDSGIRNPNAYRAYGAAMTIAERGDGRVTGDRVRGCAIQPRRHAADGLRRRLRRAGFRADARCQYERTQI
jgi:hypothetical protein